MTIYYMRAVDNLKPIGATMITPSFAQALLNESTDGEGVACMFYRLTLEIGVKFFRSKNSRDKSYAIQTIGHALGIAPKAYEKIDVETEYGGMMYGFATEIAVTVYDIISAEIGFEPYGGWYQDNEFGWYRHPDYDYIREHIERKFMSVGITTDDLHDKNIAFGPNGELWCIDFSEFSINSYMSYDDYLEEMLAAINP